MHLTLLQYLLGALSGVFVGFSLGLTGGGGSIFAVPLIVYLVGVTDPHLAIGTTTVAVAANAAINAISNARTRMVKWSCASVFAPCGVLGTVLGSTVGKSVDGQKLLFLFALLMLGVALFLVQRRHGVGEPSVKLHRHNAAKLAVIGLLTGYLSGFFGIGGGFLIVPGLILATGMPMVYAIGTSLVSVACFSAATAVSYAVSGWVDWTLALVFIAGGTAGGMQGAHLAGRLSARRGALNVIFASVMVVVAVYMLYRSGNALGLL